MNVPLHVPAGSTDRFRLREDQFRFLATGDQTGGSYSLTEVVVPTGGGPTPHTHPTAEEWFYVLEGEAAFHLGEADVLARAGDLVHIPRGTRHWFEVAAGSLRVLSGFAPAGDEVTLRALMSPAAPR